jgi:hypothetical protein
MARLLLSAAVVVGAISLYVSASSARSNEAPPVETTRAPRAVGRFGASLMERAPSLPIGRDAATFVEAGEGSISGADYLALGAGVPAAVAGRSLWLQLVPKAAEGEAREGVRLAVTFGETGVADPAASARPGPKAEGGATRVRGGGVRTEPGYAFVTCRDVAPGVDVDLRGDDGALRFDVRVASGASLESFSARIDGAESVRTSKDGGLVASTKAGDVRFGAPTAYEFPSDAEARVLPCRFVLRDDARFGFEVDGRDPAAPLVVDPVLSYASYGGGGGFDAAYAVATAGPSEAYVVGETASSDFPLTPGAFDPALVGFDAFLFKVDYAGSAIVFATYLGGSGDERATGVAVAPDGSIYVCGRTDSADFPTTPGALASALQGGRDAFVCRFAPNGATLLSSGLLGGASDDEASGLALLQDGGVVACGSTASASFPTGGGGPSIAALGGVDAFAARLSPGANSVVWARRAGGSNDDHGFGVAVDAASGDVFLGGSTASADFATTLGAWTTSPAGGLDGFVLRAAAADGADVFATRVGGSADDVVRAVASDGNGGVALAGATLSIDFPVTFGVVDPTAANEEAFVALLDPAGSAPVFASFLGGSGDDAAETVGVDVYGAVHVAGRTTSFDFDVSGDGHRTTYGGSGDAFYAKVDGTGSSLDYATFLGGPDPDVARALTTDVFGGVFVVGAAGANFPVSAGAFDVAYGGGGDAFVFAIVFCFAKPSVFNLGGGCGPTSPPLLGSTLALLGQYFAVSVSAAPPGAPGELFVSVGPPANLPYGPCTIMVDPLAFASAGLFLADASGQASLPFYVTPESFCCGLELVFQALVSSPSGLYITNGVRLTIGG